MNRRIVLLAAIAATAAPLTARAQTMTPPPGPPAPPPEAPLTPTEQAFYAQVASTLPRLYATTAAATSAGYFRYTNEDRTGAISWINPAYTDSPDVAHPSQLWYDVNGRLLGADYTQSQDRAPNGPTLFGLQPQRFHKIGLHVHFGTKNPDGTVTYGLFVRASDFQAAGGDPLHPTAETLVKMGKVASAAAVAFVVPVTNNYDAQIWVIPNPAGQFASANPNVKPSPNQGGGNGERPV